MEDILKQCVCSVSLTVNKHRDYYETAEEYIVSRDDWFKDVDADVLARMKEQNIIYELQFYPDTPVGFYVVFGTSLKEVVEKAKKCLTPTNQ